MIAKVGLYAYGIVGKSPKQLDILGIDQKNKVYPVEKGDICVVVSKIDTDKFQDEIKKLLSKLTKTAGAVPNETDGIPVGTRLGIEEVLRGHEDVVDTLMKQTTIVPIKFGTVLKDEEAALKMLQDYEGKFKKLLSKFTGREEWGIKVYADSKKFKDYIGKNEPEFLKQQGSLSKVASKGAAYLLGRKMEEELKNDVASRLAKTSEVIFQEAGKDAYEAKLNKTLPQKLTGKNKEMILNTAFLIEKEKVARFCKQVKKLIEKYEPMGIEIELSGPWPPYSFT
ncbi:MAG: GvpL/GvpF family gas vesicle protein [Candidatus Woesebacteria bacterium]|nr:GvpL/GvpF family gas vesicle protein [Candidatus Woesebacteria bacterium]